MSGFRGFLPYDEGAGESFAGRADEVARVMRLLGGEARVVVLAGPSGIGKTSLVRAGLAPALARRGAQVVTVGGYEDLDGEILRAASRLGVTPPIPNQTSGDYLARIARDSQNGLVLVFDHLEEALSDEVGRGADLGALLARVVDQGGSKLRILLSVDDASFARLDQLRDAGASGALASSVWMTLPGLTQEQVSEILERTAIQSGTFFESGLAGTVAADLCRAGRCRPLDLQLVARAIVDLRLTSVRKYQRSGGAAVLPALFFERVCAESGGRVARQALLAAAEQHEVVAEDLDARTTKAREDAGNALAALKLRGVLRSRARGRREAFSLAHAGLGDVVESFAIEDRARAAEARRALRRRLTAGERLRLHELWAVHRHLGGALAPDEQVTFIRSVRRNAIQLGLGAALVIAIFVALVGNMRRSYTLGFEPRDGTGASRVVVRLGREGLSFLSFLPNHPRFGAVLADTGFSAAGLGADTVARIAGGKASGTLDAAGSDGAGHGAAVPGWLREVVNGLRPVPRGVAKALLGDPDGVTALKQAFSDPLARRETLEALAVIGRGRAGEDEILAAALGDSAPEIRRRGVEVAASIDRRQGNGAHGATLRSALGDKSPDVRAAVLHETASLPPAEAASILAVALRDPDPTFRKGAEDATNALAERAPAAAAGALESVLQSPDGGVRRAGLTLLDAIATKDPSACAAPLRHVVADEKAPEEARVEALLMLRRAGAPSAELRPLLESAVRPEASPRLRAAALPLYARLVTPDQAEEIARTEMKGSPAARAAGAAVWGTVAMSRPDVAVKPLHALLYDSAVETRVEAARSFGYLKRDGLELVDKALKDGSAEVEKAAVESAVALAPINPYQVAEMLGHALKNVRASVRPSVIDALARIGQSKPTAAMPPLAHALKDPDVGTRVAAANAFCALADKNGAAASPYLRIAARDDRDEVRTAAAACLGELSEADPKGAARMAAELGDAAQANVRVAAAESLGRLGAKARDLAVPALLKLAGDVDRGVRLAAVRSLGAVAEKGGAPSPSDPGPFDGKRGADAEQVLDAALLHGDAAERRGVVSAAAKAGLVGVLRQASADGDETVRLDAVRSAGALGGHGLEVVRGAVDDRANSVRAEATRILAAASGAGAREVLPIFESMLRGGDKAAREAAVIGVGDLPGAGEAGARLLSEALGQRSEALRTAAARALGRLAEREPEVAQPALERAVRDPSYDVRNAAIPGLALAWSRRQTAAELGAALIAAEADSTRRFVALEALVIKAQESGKTTTTGTPADRAAARAALQQAADAGPPLARLAAQIGRAFLEAHPPDMHVFIERLLGG